MASASCPDGEVDLNGKCCPVDWEGVLDCKFSSNPNNCFLSGDIVIPNDAGVTSIGQLAFYGCEGITSVTFPEGFTSIGSEAFAECTDLVSVDFSQTSLTSIGAGAFEGSGLASVVLPEGLTSIASGAFGWCSRLASVLFPSTMPTIGTGAFQECDNIAAVIYKGSKPDIDNLPVCGAGCTEAEKKPCNASPRSLARHIDPSEVVNDQITVVLKFSEADELYDWSTATESTHTYVIDILHNGDPPAAIAISFDTDAGGDDDSDDSLVPCVNSVPKSNCTQLKTAYRGNCGCDPA